MKRILKKAFGRVTITLLIFLIQILWIYALIVKLEESYVFFSSIAIWLSVVIALVVANKRDNPAYKMTWIFLILTLPVFGITLYLLFGHSSVNRRVSKRFELVDKRFEVFLDDDARIVDEIRKEDKQIGNICRYIRNVAKYPIYRNASITYHSFGQDAIEDLKSDLKNAKEFIFMEYFIIEANGRVFEDIVDILKDKVLEGVEVRLIYDDVGSMPYFNKRDFKRIKDLGINIRTFNPIIPVAAAFMNNRDHRKLTVIDGRIAYTGGYNLADEYANLTHPFGVWKDTGIRFMGPAVDSVTAMFLAMWNSIGKESVNVDRYFKKCNPDKCEFNGYIQPYADTPLDHERVGEDVYLNIIKTACDYIYIYTPYLIIDNEILNELSLAAKSGVDVRIITPGIPDKKLIFLLTQSYYEQLIDAGVKIYQYSKGFVHAKTYICDDNVATVGTINMDYRSLFLHFECGTFLYECDAISDIKDDFISTLKECELITKEKAKKNIFIRFIQVALRLFAPLM